LGSFALISDALVFLKNQLNTYLKANWNSADPRPDPVDFIDGDKMEPLTFNLGSISILLVNLEEEKKLRAPDLYKRTSVNGTYQSVQPEIRLNLYVLFVARYSVYQQALENLSLVVQYFQSHPLFRHPDVVGLSDQIDQLSLELITLPFSEQNDVWSALRATYHPSLLYKVKMVVFQDQDGLELSDVGEIILRATP
jgi:hypothetical protein